MKQKRTKQFFLDGHTLEETIIYLQKQLPQFPDATLEECFGYDEYGESRGDYQIVYYTEETPNEQECRIYRERREKQEEKNLYLKLKEKYEKNEK